MLDLTIRLRDHEHKLVSAGKRVELGSSFVEAFHSKFITVSAVEEPEAKSVWVGEDADPYASKPSLSSNPGRYAGFDGYEGIKVLLNRAEGRPAVTVARSAAGGCPLYVSSTADTITASWRFEEVALAIPERRPNAEACRRFLKHGARPAREQILDGMFMLWPGESVTFDENGLDFFEADTPDIVVPGTLREDARATDHFVELLAQALERNLRRAENPLIEVSGGFDSSCVALAAAKIRRDLNSYGVIQEGAMGVQQRKRRQELVQLLKLNDFEAPSFRHPPFASLQVEECTITPFDDMYRLPCVYAVDAHPAKDFDLVVTGIGGDELTMENTFRREEWEVRGSICSSAVDAAAGRADMFMRRGMWLSQPYVTQSVVDFCRALPRPMRANRMLNVLTLARAGLSDGFLFPRYREHYANVITQEANLFDFDQALSESVIADYRIEDVSGPLAQAREATLRGLPLELTTRLWFLMKLEVVLRRYLA